VPLAYRVAQGAALTDLLRLRQLCNHPSLVKADDSAPCHKPQAERQDERTGRTTSKERGDDAGFSSNAQATTRLTITQLPSFRKKATAVSGSSHDDGSRLSSSNPSPSLSKVDGATAEERRTQQDDDGMRRRAFVGNLAWSITEPDLRQHFSAVGHVLRATVLLHCDGPHRGKSKGCGIVEFARAEHLPRAIDQLMGSCLRGRRITVRHHHLSDAQKGVVSTAKHAHRTSAHPPAGVKGKPPPSSAVSSVQLLTECSHSPPSPIERDDQEEVAATAATTTTDGADGLCSSLAGLSLARCVASASAVTGAVEAVADTRAVNADELSSSLAGLSLAEAEQTTPPTATSVISAPGGGQDAHSKTEQRRWRRQQQQQQQQQPGSTKTRQLAADLRKLQEDAAATGEKPPLALVFSQWTAMLDLVGSELADHHGLQTCRLDGTMGEVAQRKVIGAFSAGTAGVAMLISLQVGCVGLNLTAANHVFMLDCWWNPMVEAQACARAWRLGQQRPVHVTRYITRGTVEERVERMQRRKDFVARDVLQPCGNEALDVRAVAELFGAAT
jgi:hypothetical protein